MARRCGLVPTGGSNFYGTYRPGIGIGRGTCDLFVPDELLDELRERLPAGRGLRPEGAPG